MSHVRASLVLACGLSLGIVVGGCADGTNDPHGSRMDTGTHDAGPVDGGPRDGGPDAGPGCMTNADCPDDHVFCNGVLQCMGGRCIAANVPTCNDSITCTDDTCDGALDRCVHITNDLNCGAGLHCALSGCQTGLPCEFDGDCDDHVFCNGAESCVMGECNATGMRDCDDHMSCTMDACDESADACTHVAYTDAATNVDHCGNGTMCIMCPVPAASMHQVATCTAGACGVECLLGYFDGDGDPANGCEYMCTPTGTGIDDPDVVGDSDCDGFEGTVSDGVFVSAGGLDSNPGTRMLPLHTVSAGLAMASSMGRHAVFVSEGTYNESVTLVNGISIFGGYSMSHAWGRSGSYITTISSSTVSSGRIVAVTGTAITAPTRLSQVGISSGSSSTPGVSSYGLYCTACTALTVRACTITAGAGAAGTDGSDGTTGANGTVGSLGGGGTCDDNSPGAPGGAGGPSSCGRAGGAGGRGGNYGSNAGLAGSAGQIGTPGGAGGGGGDPGARGRDGSDGTGGGAGTDGSGGSGGSTSSSYWVSASGAAGGAGSGGNGGGGGGGGGGQGCTFCNDGNGNGGGGGGSGGCGGTGAGGAAGGQVCTGEVGGGGSGGRGGNGGRGGHGGGGAGGPSYAVYRLGTTVDPTGNTLANGGGGAGGASPGNPGVAGAGANVF